MPLNLLNSKTFFGTESSQESSELCKALAQANIRCSDILFKGKDIVKHYSSDPFHIYAKSYLQKLSEFHVIKVHRMDFKKAIELYNNEY